MRIFLNIILLFVVCACSSPSVDESGHGMKRRKLGKYFLGTGMTRYVLPQIPQWANFSESARCYRTKPVRYFNIPLLKNSFAMDHEKALQFQNMFNTRAKEMLKNTDLLSLPPKTEENLFFEISDKILSGIKSFTPPKFKKVNLILIDDDFKKERLKKLMNSSEMDKGFPVFISLCHDALTIEQYIEKNKIYSGLIKTIGIDFLSIFDVKNKKHAAYRFGLNEILRKDQEVTLFTSTGRKPKEIDRRKTTIKKY